MDTGGFDQMNSSWAQPQNVKNMCVSTRSPRAASPRINPG